MWSSWFAMKILDWICPSVPLPHHYGINVIMPCLPPDWSLWILSLWNGCMRRWTSSHWSRKQTLSPQRSANGSRSRSVGSVWAGWASRVYTDQDLIVADRNGVFGQNGRFPIPHTALTMPSKSPLGSTVWMDLIPHDEELSHTSCVCS